MIPQRIDRDSVWAPMVMQPNETVSALFGMEQNNGFSRINLHIITDEEKTISILLNAKLDLSLGTEK